MDPLTHAASGAVAMLILPNRPATFWAAPLAAIACASPDIDLAFIRTPEEFLMLHRGITHSFAFMPVFALILAFLCWPLWRKGTPFAWKFGGVWLFCCAMILLHIWLDVVTTYGTMIFLPFSHYRVRLNSIYIIDFLVTIPLLWAIWRWRNKRRLLIAVLIWIFIYPASGIFINRLQNAHARTRLSEEGHNIKDVIILPDAFAPLFWRVLYEEESLVNDNPINIPKDNHVETIVGDQSINAFGGPRAAPIIYQAANKKLVNMFINDSLAGDVFFHFVFLPVMEKLPPQFLPSDSQNSNFDYLLFYDLRFGTGLEFVRKILELRPNADLPFLFMAELNYPGGNSPDHFRNPRLERLRLRFSDSGRDSQWKSPELVTSPHWYQWVAGLR